MTKKDKEYIRDLSEEYDCPIDVIMTLVYLLGENELYDGITTSIQDDWAAFKDF